MKVFERTDDGAVLVYNYGGYNFLTSLDAQNFGKVVRFSNYSIRKIVYEIGIPQVVNLEESLKNNKLVYYKDEEISLIS